MEVEDLLIYLSEPAFDGRQINAIKKVSRKTFSIFKAFSLMPGIFIKPVNGC